MRSSLAILLSILMLLALACSQAFAQAVMYANPAQENELVDNEHPSYLVGFLHNNILIGKINENNGFYLSVYNNKLGLQNNVIYKELDLEQFDILDVLNLNDVGLLYVHRKARAERPSLLYAITFSDTGVPIRDADILDSLPLSWNDYSPKFLMKISSNRRYVLALAYVQAKDAYWLRGVLLNDNGKILQRQQWTIALPKGSDSEREPQLCVANDGNSYMLLEQINSQGFVQPLFYQLPAHSSAVIQHVLTLDNLKIRKLKLSLDDLHNRLFLYGIYESNHKTDARGLYGIWWDKAHQTGYGGRAWPMHELIPKLKSSQHNNLELGRVVFLKNGGFVGYMDELVQNLKLSTHAPSNLELGPIIFLRPGEKGANAENAYVFVITEDFRVQAKHTIYKHQQQNNDNNLLGITALNAGNLLYYLYNDFQNTGDITLNSYILDPKYQFVKKSFGMYANNNFVISLSQGKQIAPFAYLAPCVFKDRWRSFALIVL